MINDTEVNTVDGSNGTKTVKLVSKGSKLLSRIIWISLYDGHSVL